VPRIAGVDVPNDKRIEIGLTYIYGIGPTLAGVVLKEAGIDPGVRAKNLTEDEVSRIAGIIDRNQVVEGQLRRQVAQDIARLKDVGSYRGMRHRRGLPARGQRTRSNARTRKGPRKTVAGKKGVKEMHRG
jgi:small subunit ribosomal protein S13